jgi:hypothetical protein
MTRVDATFSAKRNIVANKRTVGKDENSSGLRVLMAIMMTTRLHMMLKVNKKSNNSGGSGNTNMAMMTSTTTGILSPVRSNFDKFCRIVDRVSVLISEIQLKLERLDCFFAVTPCHGQVHQAIDVPTQTDT